MNRKFQLVYNRVTRQYGGGTSRKKCRVQGKAFINSYNNKMVKKGKL